MQKILRRLCKWIGFIALGCYVFLGVAFLGIRYWVMPNIDQWREPLQREISELLPGQVELGQITAQWRGRHPSISLRNTTLRDEQGRLLLSVPTLNAVVSWSSLFTRSPRFLELNADGVALSLRRDTQDRISLMGYALEATDQQDTSEEAGLLHWLSEQRHVSFTNARIVWRDEMRAAPALELRDVDLSLGTEGADYVVSIKARPPADLGTSFMLLGRAQVTLHDNRPLSLADISGLFHINVEQMQPAGWQPWLDVYSLLEQGRVSWRGWQQVTGGELGRHVSQVLVQNGVWRSASELGVAAESTRLYVAGEWAALEQAFSPGSAHRESQTALPHSPVRVAVQMKGLQVEAGEVFESPLLFDEVAVLSGVQRDAATGLRLEFDHAQVRNADMDLVVQGNWQEKGGDAGLIDLQGRFERAELAAIVRYLPAVVNDDARIWLRHGLLAGRLLEAPVRLQGDMAYFPFGEQPDSGDFILGGAVKGAVIDYAPAAVVGEPGWPRLENLDGYAQLHKVDLTIRADTMQMRPGGQTIQLSDVDARIPNIEYDSVLEVKGHGQAEAGAFLALMRESPLGDLLDGMFDAARGEGQWQVPIALTIPLLNTDDSRVEGEVVFDQGGLELDDTFPALSGLTGRLAFSEEHLSAQGLKGQVLGGPVTIGGGIGREHKALLFDGRLSAKGLNEYLDGQLTGLLEGATDYRLSLKRGAKGAYGMELKSALEGLTINLPDPFFKSGERRWPLRAEWEPASSKRDATLKVELAENIQAVFAHNEQHKDSFFHSAALSVNGKAELPASGLAVDLQAPLLDLDIWRKKMDGLGANSVAGNRPLFPSVSDIRLQADKARVFNTELDHLTFTARRPQGDRWRVDVSSTQTAGTLFWQEKRGHIQGNVEAHFQRLALGAEPSALTQKKNNKDSVSFELDDDIKFPGIQLRIDHLRVSGREIGALSVVGVNEAQGRRWRLEQLQLSGPHASLQGNGMWLLDGPGRGLTLQAEALFDDLGAYLAHIGFNGVMEGGHGHVRGTVKWRDLPWGFELSGLQGDLDVEFSKGRFLSMGSRSARLLEVLSLQSVQRLASFNWNPAGLLKQGFPFDTLLGQIKLENGVMHSENYRVTGPVATIIIAGDVDLPHEGLDLYAIVVPNLDVSGAAIAAGIVVNPLVGVGAFLTQWLLKSPMSKAMTIEYQVKGSFDAPQIDVVDSNAAGKAGKAP